MPHLDWQLRNGRPSIQIFLTLAQGGQQLIRNLLADSGAGSMQSIYELILEEDDCLLCSGNPLQSITLRGAYIGSYPVYVLPVEIPALGFATKVRAVGVPSVPVSFHGIACFRFLNRFHYGNFGDPGVFGLES